MRRLLGAICAVVLLTSGCGNGVDGTAVADAPTEQWDPCSIPADAIAASGLDAIDMKSGWGEGFSEPDWQRCLWTGPMPDKWYFFGVLFSQSIRLDDLRQDPRFAENIDIDLGDRKAIQFRPKVGETSNRCEVAFTTTKGLIRLYVTAMGNATARADPCTVIVEHAYNLSQYFPSEP